MKKNIFLVVLMLVILTSCKDNITRDVKKVFLLPQTFTVNYEINSVCGSAKLSFDGADTLIVEFTEGNFSGVKKTVTGEKVVNEIDGLIVEDANGSEPFCLIREIFLSLGTKTYMNSSKNDKSKFEFTGELGKYCLYYDTNKNRPISITADYAENEIELEFVY